MNASPGEVCFRSQVRRAKRYSPVYSHLIYDVIPDGDKTVVHLIF